MAYPKTTWIDKAVQYAKRYYMNSDGGNDKNLLPPFSDWSLNASSVIDSANPYRFTLTATAGFKDNILFVTAIPNTTYTISGTISGELSVLSVDSSGSLGAALASINGAGTTISTTFTTNSTTRQLRVDFYNTAAAAGTFTFTNPQLEQAASATAFTPKKMYTITQSGGTVTQAGTPLNAANLNKMEQGIADALRKDGSEPMTGALSIVDTGSQIKRVGGDVFINSGNGYLISSANAQYDGTNWNRINTSAGATRVYQTFTGLVIYTAPAGANPIVWSSPYQIWDETKIRFTNGYVEWNNGGTWYPMGDSPVGINRTFSNQASGTANTWTTVVNVTGVYGRLDYIKVDVPPGAVGDIKVTVDGLSDTMTGTLNTGGVNLPLTYLTGTEEPVRFNNSLKIEIRSTLGGGGAVLGFYGYRLKAGTP